MLVGEEPPAAVLDEEARELEVAPLAGDAPELDEGKLDLGMPRVAEALGRRPEHGIDAVGEAHGHIEEVPLARRLVVRHRGLEQVPGAVKLVVVPQVDPTPPGLLHGVIAVDVAIGRLGAGDGGDDFIEPRGEDGIGIRRQGVCRGLQRLVDVRVHEDRALVARRRLLRRQTQVLEVAGLLQVVQVDGNRNRPVRLAPWRPERIRDGDIGERHRAETARRAGAGRVRRQHGGQGQQGEAESDRRASHGRGSFRRKSSRSLGYGQRSNAPRC